MRILLLMFGSILLVGCSGRIYTVQSPTFVDGKTEGVLFYGYKAIEKKVVLDRIRHPKTGNITHSIYEVPGTGNYCAPQIKVTKVVIADYETQYAVTYEPGLFETNKFSVALDKGMLKAVNSESTPAIKTAVESLQGIAELRENILDGFVKASDTSNEVTINSILGQAPKAAPIKCSSNE